MKKKWNFDDFHNMTPKQKQDSIYKSAEYLKKKRLRRQARINRQRGKSVQQKHADMLGIKNVGTLGKEDGYDPLLLTESKGREKFGAGVMELLSWLGQVEQHIIPEQLAALICHRTDTRYKDDFVVMRFGTFIRLWNKFTYGEERPPRGGTK